MNESRGFPGSWLTSPESPGTAATRAYLFRVEVGSASERHLEVLQGKGVMHDRVDMDECMKSIDLRSNLGLIRRHGGCSGLGVTKWPKSHASFAASRDALFPLACTHLSPLLAQLTNSVLGCPRWSSLSGSRNETSQTLFSPSLTMMNKKMIFMTCIKSRRGKRKC